jgi:Spy/CpxP family protein refolding chaperone
MISIDMTKAKDIAHEKRRAARTTEFAPLDIKATIPSEAAAAEAARQAIREKYATLQAQMDAAQTPEQLKALLPKAKFVEIK